MHGSFSLKTQGNQLTHNFNLHYPKQWSSLDNLQGKANIEWELPHLGLVLNATQFNSKRIRKSRIGDFIFFSVIHMSQVAAGTLFSALMAVF